MKGLRCEEFIYRIRSLTRKSFAGNFDVVCDNLHILLDGKAKSWYWRYHKTVEDLEWEPFVAALRHQYKDFRTSSDIEEELRNRKQRHNESFEDFYDAMLDIADHLPVGLEDEELIAKIVKNQRFEIRWHLLGVKIQSIAELKKLCLDREQLCKEETSRRTQFARGPPQQRRLAALDAEEIDEFKDDGRESDDNPSMAVNALTKSDKIIKCYNCDEIGHYWDMCVKKREIFCYGCGLKGVYKPQCEICSKNPKFARGFLPNNQKTQQ